jgi:hypothetical protein
MIEIPLKATGGIFGKQTEEKIIDRDVNHPLYVKQAAGMGFATVDHMCDRISGVWQKKLSISPKK